MLALGVLVSACELPDNIDMKAAQNVTAGELMTDALRNSLALIDDMSQNTNIGRMLCQYIGMTQYTDPSRYVFDVRQIPDRYWDRAYLVLNDFKETKKLLAEEVGDASFMKENANRGAIVEIMEVLTYHNLVDYFGNVPYTEALGGASNKTPAYDDQVDIYNDLQARLTAAIATLTANAAYGSWGDKDLVYEGDVAMWKKFAATLKARLAMRVADVNPTQAQSELTAAIDAGMLEAGESMQLSWIGVNPHNNTIYTMFEGARTDYAPANTIVDKMLELDDARLSSYFSTVDTSTEVGVIKPAYVGIPYGAITVPYNNVSHFSAPMFKADFPATFACHAEVEFLLAEAAARGMTVPGTAQEHYEAGIAESHAFWGAEYDAAVYLAHPDVAWDDARNKELIGIQKWLALYNRGNEGYASWRCFDWPVLNVPMDMEYTDIPFRMPYPYNEPDLNAVNYAAAAEAIGGDNVRTRIFWDDVEGTKTPSPAF